jgi:hypothetical protein
MRYFFCKSKSRLHLGAQRKAEGQTRGKMDLAFYEEIPTLKKSLKG